MKNDRLSWNELHAYTNAKVVLRRVNGLLAKSREGEPGVREELLRKTGELAIDVMDSITGESAIDEHAYARLLERGNGLVDGILDAGLMQNEKGVGKPDWEILRSITCIGALGMRLSDFKLLGDADRELPEELVGLDTAGRTYESFKKAAQELPEEHDRRASAGEFAAAYAGFANAVAVAEAKKSIKEKLAQNRATGQMDFLDDAARRTARALMHVNAGLYLEKADDRRELYSRCARLVIGAKGGAVEGMYGALVSDDPLHSAKRLFEAEKEAFLAGKNSLQEDVSWELDSILGKLGAYERLAGEAFSFVRDVAARELVEGNEDAPDRHLIECVRKIKGLCLEMNASASLLFHNHYGPSRRLYDAVDAAKSGQCAAAGAKAIDKLEELLALCYACDATARLYDGKKTDEKRFDAIYGDILRMTKKELLNARGNLEEIVPQYVAERRQA